MTATTNRTVEYEWDVETIAMIDTADHEAGEVLDHAHQSSKTDAIAEAAKPSEPGTGRVVVLVRDDVFGRSWAYLNADGTMPTHFSDAFDRSTHKVPARFR
jgi:hypothetical protein